MKTNPEIFRKGDRLLRTLYMDMIFLEDIRPVLFTCVDEYNTLYICSCFRANGERADWMIVQTSEESVIALLTNQMPIHDVFSNGREIFIMTLMAGTRKLETKAFPRREVPEDTFPTDGYYMEPDEGEFDEEIEELRRRSDKTLLVTWSKSVANVFQIPVQYALLQSSGDTPVSTQSNKRFYKSRQKHNTALYKFNRFSIRLPSPYPIDTINQDGLYDYGARKRRDCA